jgi:hypothetical protein
MMAEHRAALAHCRECGRTADSLAGWFEDFVEDPPGTSFLAQFCGAACADSWWRRHPGNAAKQHMPTPARPARRRRFGVRPTAMVPRRGSTVTRMSDPDAVRYSHIVAQASGMVSVQADCHVSQAIVLMKRRGEQTHETLEQIAAAIVRREIRFNL